MAPDPSRTLSVLPNPYHSLDAFGRPACAVMYEPDPGGFTNLSHRGWIGASVDPDATVIHDKFSESELRSNRQDTAWKFDASAPVLVPLSEYYLHHLRDGSLLPADERTARAAGITFEPADKAHKRTRDRKLAAHRATYGAADDNHADHGDEPKENDK